MSNSSIIRRLHLALDQYESGEITPEDVQRISEPSMQALESIDFAAIHQARSLCSRLVHAHFWCGDEEFIDIESVSVVIREFREFLDGVQAKEQP